ncbi:MAG: GNAT family N-acetyltransferase [Chloroflexota bacterium]|nr:GNAT family N-acetyltransferase [Chloroflexota bacterium]
MPWVQRPRHLTVPLNPSSDERRPGGTRFDGMLEQQGKTAWFFLICRRGEDTPIGTTGLFNVDLTNGSAGIGISLGDPSDTGQGLGTDALEALVDFGFGRLRLERMWLDVYEFNERAIRSYEKAGFVREGAARHGAYRDGRFVDLVSMAILRDEWATRRAADAFPGRWPPPDVE